MREICGEGSVTSRLPMSLMVVLTSKKDNCFTSWNPELSVRLRC